MDSGFCTKELYNLMFGFMLAEEVSVKVDYLETTVYANLKILQDILSTDALFSFLALDD